jgi:hypothetical protein
MTAAQSRIIQLLRNGQTIHNSYLGPFATRGTHSIDLNPRTVRALLDSRRLIVRNNMLIIPPTPVHK